MNMVSRKSLYAIHALICMAGRATETVSVNWIAKSKKIPRKFLEVIMLDLKKAQILGSKQGKGGGYYLLRAPETITVLDVIHIIDGKFLIIPCLPGNKKKNCLTCMGDNECLLKNKLENVLDETQRMLTSCSIKEFIESAEEPVSTKFN